MPRIVAFVAGITNYRELFKLPYAQKAAKALANVLKKLPGAKVHEVYDCNFVDFKDKYKAFLGEIEVGDIVIFFFAGHGCQWKKEPLLIVSAMDPDDKIEYDIGPESVRERAKNVHELQKDLRAKETELNVILLDCCGEIRYGARTRGDDKLHSQDSQVFHIDTDEKTIIGFSSSPDDEAYKGKGSAGDSGYGFYVESLMRHLPTPKVDIDVVLRRVDAEVFIKSKGKQNSYRMSCINEENKGIL